MAEYVANEDVQTNLVTSVLETNDDTPTITGVIDQDMTSHPLLTILSTAMST